MSSTDTERQLRAFFREHLVPVAARCDAGTMLPMTGDPSIASYYRRRDGESKYVFELDTADAAAHLAELWKDQPALLGLIGPLLTLAGSLAERADAPAELSPFVYAMF